MDHPAPPLLGDLQGDPLLLPRLHHGLKLRLPHRLPVPLHLIGKAIAPGVRKELAVFDEKASCLRIRHKAQGRKIRLYLHRLGRGRPIPIDDAVSAELVVRGPVAEISAVGQEFFPVPPRPLQGLVNIVPDKSPLIARILLLQDHVLVHSPQGISHGVHVLAHDEGLLGVLLKKGLHIRRLCIHLALHIADVLVGPVPEHPLIVNQAAAIPLPEILAHGLYALPCIGLISTGPNENRGVILVPLQHGAAPVHGAGLPLLPASRHVPGGIAGHHFLPGSVGLQIGLVNHIEAVLVAELVPPGLIGIMAGPHRVDVVLL